MSLYQCSHTQTRVFGCSHHDLSGSWKAASFCAFACLSVCLSCSTRTSARQAPSSLSPQWIPQLRRAAAACTPRLGLAEERAEGAGGGDTAQRSICCSCAPTATVSPMQNDSFPSSLMVKPELINMFPCKKLVPAESSLFHRKNTALD